MNKKIILTLILGIFFFNFISATYNIEISSINYGELDIYGNNYKISAVNQPISEIVTSGEYEICVGFLCSTKNYELQHAGKPFLFEEKIKFLDKYGTYLAIFLTLFPFCFIFVLARRKKEKDKTRNI